MSGAAAVLGIVTLNDEWRYSAIIYAPVLGFLVWETIKGRIEQVRFRAVTHSLREVLVPGLVDAIDDAHLRQLVRYEVVYASGQKIRVIDDGGYVQFVIAGEEEESVAGWGGGGGEGFGGEGIGGDGGGGGGGDGGGC